MSARSSRRLTALACGLLVLAQVVGAAPMQRKEPKAVSTLNSAYKMMQNGSETGTETIERIAYDDNTIHFNVVNKLAPGPGLRLDQELALVVEEESYFPRTLHVAKTVAQGEDSFLHTVDVQMFANLAVIESKIGETKGGKRLVVPTGIAVQELGVLAYWYQILFWYDRDAGGRQRFQWLEPTNGSIGNGEIYVSGQETVKVLGRKTPVTVYTIEREQLGPAILKVDAKGRIVAGEQNMTTFELVKQTEK